MVPTPLDDIAEELELIVSALEALARVFRRRERGETSSDEFLDELREEEESVFDDEDSLWRSWR